MEERQAVAALAALAHAVRLSVFRLLVKSGSEGVPSGSIATAVGIPPTAMSFHLAALERAGLVASQRRGRHVLYAVDYDATRRLIGFLTEDCCGGRPELCGDLAAAACCEETIR